MSAYDIERLSRLIGMLPPAPEAWVRAAQELPGARRELETIVERAEADAAFRAALVADLESALRAERSRRDRCAKIAHRPPPTLFAVR